MTIVFLLYHTWLLAQFPPGNCWLPCPLPLTPPDPVSQGSQPFTSPPSWCGASLLVVPPNPVFPSLGFSESRLPCGPTFRSLTPQPPWLPSLLGRRCNHVIELQPRRGLLEDSGEDLAAQCKEHMAGGCLSYVWLGPWCGRVVPRCHSHSCNQENGWEVSPQSEILSCWTCRDYPDFLLSQANKPFWT